MSNYAEVMDQQGTEVVKSSEIKLSSDERDIVDSQVATAKKFPRSVKRAVQNALTMVTLDINIASKCTYSVPRKGKAITGPSVYLARILAQCWGNMRVQMKVVAIGDKTITCEGTAWDLESNLAVQGQVQRSIFGSSGRYSEDMIVVTGNAGNAIAFRNAVLAVIPKSITDTVYKAALDKITGDVSDENKLISKRKAVVDNIRETYGVTEAEICKAVGKNAIENISVKDLVTLVGISNALENGDTTIEEAFRDKKTSAFEETQNKAEARMIELIRSAETLKDLEKLSASVKTNAAREEYDKKLKELKPKK